MTTRTESMRGWPSIQVQSTLTAKPQRHVGTYSPTHGALPLPSAGWCCAPWASRTFVLAVTPVVVAMYVTTVDVDPWLLLVNNLTLSQTGESQGVETHRTLGTGSIQLLAKGLQLFEGGGVAQSSRGPPQQGGPTQINQRSILKCVWLIFNLQKRKGDRNVAEKKKKRRCISLHHWVVRMRKWWFIYILARFFKLGTLCTGLVHSVLGNLLASPFYTTTRWHCTQLVKAQTGDTHHFNVASLKTSSLTACLQISQLKIVSLKYTVQYTP